MFLSSPTNCQLAKKREDIMENVFRNIHTIVLVDSGEQFLRDGKFSTFNFELRQLF